MFRLASVEFSKCAARAKVQVSNLATSGCLLASKFQALLAQGLVSLKVKVEHCEQAVYAWDAKDHGPLLATKNGLHFLSQTFLHKHK